MPGRTIPITAECPDCAAEIVFSDRPKLADTVTCPECSTLLEVVSVNPLELEWAFEEDLDDGDDELDDDGFDDEDDFDDDDFDEAFDDDDFDDEDRF